MLTCFRGWMGTLTWYRATLVGAWADVLPLSFASGFNRVFGRSVFFQKDVFGFGRFVGGAISRQVFSLFRNPPKGDMGVFLFFTYLAIWRNSAGPIFIIFYYMWEI